MRRREGGVEGRGSSSIIGHSGVPKVLLRSDTQSKSRHTHHAPRRTSDGEVNFSALGTLFGVGSSLLVCLNGIYTKKVTLLPLISTHARTRTRTTQIIPKTLITLRSLINLITRIRCSLWSTTTSGSSHTSTTATHASCSFPCYL